MGGLPAEQIIAGVVLSERLAVTMYGAIHRAQLAGQRNLRGLVVDPKLLEDPSFRAALTEGGALAAATALAHPSIVSTMTVESEGADVVVVTRGGGRYVTVQDLIASAKADRGQGGKLPLPVAASIGKAVVEALAAAHAAGLVHGAVHPRSVLVDEDGAVRLGDFLVGRALTTAVAQGADSSLWRGLSGYIAPELVVGETPTTATDVFAVGALLFTMLSGEVPPGALRVTPAVERLVHRALDTDLVRRYRSAQDLLENMLEAFEDDRWELADRDEVIKAAGLSRADTSLDDATEDLLASLGDSAVQVTPMRPSMDIRAEAAAARHSRGPTTGAGRLDALLADLDEPSDEDPDDLTPLPPPYRDSDREIAEHSSARAEAAAIDALAGLDALDEDAPARGDATEPSVPPAPSVQPARPAAPEAPRPSARAVARPNLEEIPDFAIKPPRLRSRALGIVSLLVVIGGGVAFYSTYQKQRSERAAAEERQRQREAEAEERTRLASEAQADRGTISVRTSPADASVWLKLGRTNLDTLPLTSSQMHRIRLEMPGYQPVDTEVVPASWSGSGDARKASVNVTLKALVRDPRTGEVLAEPLPARPPNLAVEPTGFEPGEGPLHIETSPPGAEVWLLIGYGNTGVSFPTIAGRAYELRALSDGHLAGYATITADEWRDGGSPNIPIDMAKKKAVLDKFIELPLDPHAKPARRTGSKKGT